MAEYHMDGSRVCGLKLRFGKWKFRMWRYGFEINDNYAGRVWFFPWAPKHY